MLADQGRRFSMVTCPADDEATGWVEHRSLHSRLRPQLLPQWPLLSLLALPTPAHTTSSRSHSTAFTPVGPRRFPRDGH